MKINISFHEKNIYLRENNSAFIIIYFCFYY